MFTSFDKIIVTHNTNEYRICNEIENVHNGKKRWGKNEGKKCMLFKICTDAKKFMCSTLEEQHGKHTSHILCTPPQLKSIVWEHHDFLAPLKMEE